MHSDLWIQIQVYLCCEHTHTFELIHPIVVYVYIHICESSMIFVMLYVHTHAYEHAQIQARMTMYIIIQTVVYSMHAQNSHSHKEILITIYLNTHTYIYMYINTHTQHTYALARTFMHTCKYTQYICTYTTQLTHAFPYIHSVKHSCVSITCAYACTRNAYTYALSILTTKLRVPIHRKQNLAITIAFWKL